MKEKLKKYIKDKWETTGVFTHGCFVGGKYHKGTVKTLGLFEPHRTGVRYQAELLLDLDKKFELGIFDDKD